MHDLVRIMGKNNRKTTNYQEKRVMIYHRLLATIKWSSLSLVLLLVAIPTVTWATLPAYMRITGQTQGAIMGSVTKAGEEDNMEVVGFGHSTACPLIQKPGGPQVHANTVRYGF